MIESFPVTNLTPLCRSSHAAGSRSHTKHHPRTAGSPMQGCAKPAASWVHRPLAPGHDPGTRVLIRLVQKSMGRSLPGSCWRWIPAGAAAYCALHPCNLVSWLCRPGCTPCNPLLPGRFGYGARDVGEDFFWCFFWIFVSPVQGQFRDSPHATGLRETNR